MKACFKIDNFGNSNMYSLAEESYTDVSDCIESRLFGELHIFVALFVAEA